MPCVLTTLSQSICSNNAQPDFLSLFLVFDIIVLLRYRHKRVWLVLTGGPYNKNKECSVSARVNFRSHSVLACEQIIMQFVSP